MCWHYLIKRKKERKKIYIYICKAFYFKKVCRKKSWIMGSNRAKKESFM